MDACETCGNKYDKSFTVVMSGLQHTFDCFECAVQSLAPSCHRCGCRVMGHGAEVSGKIFCGAHCAGEAGYDQLRDRA